MRALGSGPASRRGASIAELLVALVLFAIVGAATLAALDRQARFHGGVMAILEARSQHAATHEALAAELRGASSAAGDILRLSDSAVVFRLTVGAGVACAIAPGYVDLAPDSVAAGQVLARMRTSPQQGDTAWLLDEGASGSPADDRWIALALQALSHGPGGCAGSPLVDPVADAGRPSWRLYIAGAGPGPTARPGAPVRLTRIARFALYRGGTGESWLGFAERAASGGWVTIQPVSGPYLPYRPAQPAASGVALLATDSSGAELAAPGPGRATALRLATRTLTTRPVRMDGLARGRHADSLHSLTALRNNR